MEQIGIFVEEYAEWVSVGSSVVMLILLIYVLHRIKKTERTNLLMNREMEKRLQQIEKESRGERRTGEILQKEKKNVCQTVMQPDVKEGEQSEKSVTVINDVIEEVFS